MRPFLFSLGFSLALIAPANAQLLDGEFGDIDLGREMLAPDKFPSLRELREVVSRPRIEFVMMIKLHADESHNHHLPVWSHDGLRLAFQQSRVGVSSSKLLLFGSLAAEKPTLLSERGDDYDYTFRWGLNHPASFVFARIEAASEKTRLFYSDGEGVITPRTPQGGRFFYPSLYERTDGVHWLAYEKKGEIVHHAWSGEEGIERAVARGTSPRWSRDGRRLLMARQAGLSGSVGSYDIVVRHLREETDTVLSSKQGVVVRTPAWSPDETQAAFYESDTRDGAPWRIQVAATNGRGNAATLVDDVIVNPDFKSEGPAWDASGERIWCFSHAHREQEFYPLVAANIATGNVTLVQYPRRATSPRDVSVNPVTAIPELAFVAHDGLTRDLFVVLLNHY